MSRPIMKDETKNQVAKIQVLVGARKTAKAPRKARRVMGFREKELEQPPHIRKVPLILRHLALLVLLVLGTIGVSHS